MRVFFFALLFLVCGGVLYMPCTPYSQYPDVYSNVPLYIVYGPYKLVTSFTMMHCALDELSAHEVMYLLRESL